MGRSLEGSGKGCATSRQVTCEICLSLKKMAITFQNFIKLSVLVEHLKQTWLLKLFSTLPFFIYFFKYYCIHFE